MSTVTTISFTWIPEKLGGHNADPWVGMRVTIRWQRYLDEFMKRAWDVECRELDYDSDTNQGRGVFAFASHDPLPHAWRQRRRDNRYSY